MKTVLRKEKLYERIAEGLEAGGLSIKSLNVTKNGTYNAPEGVAYKSVDVEVLRKIYRSVGTLNRLNDAAVQDFYFAWANSYAEIELNLNNLVAKGVPVGLNYIQFNFYDPSINHDSIKHIIFGLSALGTLSFQANQSRGIKLFKENGEYTGEAEIGSISGLTEVTVIKTIHNDH